MPSFEFREGNFALFTSVLRGHDGSQSYVSCRAQRVVLDGVASQWAPVTPSVPQGSLLGPLLFTIFINDLLGETVGEVRAALYADDTKLYKNVSSFSDCLSLQTTLANLNDWSKGNNINFNTSKCKTLTVTRKKTPLIYEYTLNNKQNLCECLRKKI